MIGLFVHPRCTVKHSAVSVGPLSGLNSASPSVKSWEQASQRHETAHTIPAAPVPYPQHL